MTGSKLGLFLLSVVALVILFLTGSDAGCSSVRPSYPKWVNNWQQTFGVRCHTSYSLKIWQSQYRNCKGDRIHFFSCQRGPFAYHHVHCTLTYNVNYYDRPLAFKCANNGVIAGVGSTYSVAAKDRRFSFRCCRKHGYIAHTCKHTAIQNTWHRPLRYVVPSGYYLVGAFSEHQNSKQDRIWKFEICKFSRVLSG